MRLEDTNEFGTGRKTRLGEMVELVKALEAKAQAYGNAYEAL